MPVNRKSFFESSLCQARKRCQQCRLSPEYRAGIVKTFAEPTDPDFECPYGKTKNDFDMEAMPSLYKQAVNLARSGKNFAGAALKTGQVRVSQEERDARLAICTGDKDTPKCFRYVPSRERCTGCGCNMPFKTWLAGMKCPEGKWEDD